MLGLKPRATSCGTNSSLKYFLVTCTISLIRHLLCTVAPLLSVSTILHFVFWRELNPYGAGWICTVRLVWPRINSRWHENLKVLFPATDARSTLSQMFISLFFFFFPTSFAFLALTPCSVLLSKEWSQVGLSWVLEKDALGAKNRRAGKHRHS